MSTISNLLDYRRIWQRRMRRPARLYGTDQALADRMSSRDPAARVAAVEAGPLTARLLEVALASRHDDVRLAAVTSSALSSAQLDWILRNDREEVRLAAVKAAPRLDTTQVEAALHDPSDAVRIAAIEQHALTDEQIEVLLTDRNRDIREAVLAHHSVDPEYVEKLLHSDRRRDGRDLAQALAHQPLTEVQVESALSRPVRTEWDREARRVAALQASVERAQLLLADPDPVVVEAARDQLADYEQQAAGVAAVLAQRDERPADVQMQAAGQRELRVEREAAASRAARDENWWFDKAWEERTAIRAAIGHEPDGPEVELAAARQVVADAEREEREAEQRAGMIPPGHRHLLAADVTAAQERAGAAQRRLDALQVTVADGTHPAVQQRQEWRELHADELARLAVLEEDMCAALEREAAEPDAVREAIPMPPVAERERGVWLDEVGPYAAMRARVERTGHTTDADVAAAVEYRHTLVDLGARAARLGIVDPDWYDADVCQFEGIVAQLEAELSMEAAAVTATVEPGVRVEGQAAYLRADEPTHEAAAAPEMVNGLAPAWLGAGVSAELVAAAEAELAAWQAVDIPGHDLSAEQLDRGVSLGF